MGMRGPKTNRLPFDEWWPIVLQLWRQSGRTAAIPETKLRKLYDDGLPPLNANDTLITEDRANKERKEEA